MDLVDVDYAYCTVDVPDDVADFLREAEIRVGRFLQTGSVRKTGFVPSDYLVVYRILRGLLESNVVAGNTFCEWGSGFGVVASLAAMLGFDSHGIELEKQLVEAGRLLARDFGLPTRFVQGSFIPSCAEACVAETYADTNREYFWLLQRVNDAYDEMQLGIDRFDIVFSYPWPGEEYLVERLFADHAAPGALLLMYSDVAPTCVRQKVVKPLSSEADRSKEVGPEATLSNH